MRNVIVCICAAALLSGCAAVKLQGGMIGPDLNLPPDGVGAKIEVVNTADATTIAGVEAGVSPSAAVSAITSPAVGLVGKIKSLLGL